MRPDNSEKYILYADDDIDDQEIMSEMIAGLDPSMEVVALGDGKEVIEFLESLPENAVYPSLIILDVNMPQLDGLETLRRLKSSETFRKITVVMFSTSDQPKDKAVSLDLGAEDFITKPVHADELERITARFCDYCKGTPARTRFGQ